jgi:hypothetical protein
MVIESIFKLTDLIDMLCFCNNAFILSKCTLIHENYS